MFSRIATFALALCTVPAFASEEPLAACTAEGGEVINLLKTGFGAVSVNGVDDVAFSARKLGEYGMTYSIETARGHWLTIRMDAGGDMQIWDSAAWGPCTRGPALFNAEALDALVREVASRKKFQLARCTDDAGLGVNFTLSPSARKGEALVQADFERGGESLFFVAHGMESEGAMGSSYRHLGGYGSLLYAAAGQHHSEVRELRLRHGNHTGEESIELETGLGFESFGKCTLNNVWYLEQLIRSGR